MTPLGIHPQDRIAIIGGGFTGAALALHLVKLGHPAARITVFEPRAALGAGVAYSSAHPTHRFNGPLDLLAIFPQDMTHFVRWYQAHGIAQDDPDAMAPTGQLYARRADFGRYMAELVATHARGIIHLRRMAVDVEPADQGFAVIDDAGARHGAERVFLCTAQDAPRLPRGFEAVAGLPNVVADPWAPGALDRVPADGDVLILGTALTAVDVAAALLERGQGGQIVAVSRRGLTPRPQDRLPPAEERYARFVSGISVFRERFGQPATARALLRAARVWIAEALLAGRRWQDAFDDVRDGLAPIWAGWPLAEKRRALRHLRAYYDVHRYRMAPQLAAMMARAEAAGRLAYIRARARAEGVADGQCRIRLHGHGPAETRSFAAIVNCTGPVADITASTNPLIGALLRRGMIRPDPTGLGAMVDAQCRLIAADGVVQPQLHAFGSLTRGRFGDLTAVPQINMQILRALTGDPLGRVAAA